MTALDRKYGTPCIVCGAPIVKGIGHDAGCMAAGRKPRTWHELGRIIGRAEYRWRRRQRQHALDGSHAHPAVVEAMYLLDALYVARRERAA